MDLNNLLSQLSVTEKKFNEIREEELVRELLLIQEEAPLLKEFAVKLVDTVNSKNINGEDAVLIYVFESNGKTLISPEVFITRSGKIVYEVFDEVNYLKYRPNAIIKNNYNYMEVEEFLRVIPFRSIYSYFLERIEILNEDIVDMKKNNDLRKKFVEENKEEVIEKWRQNKKIKLVVGGRDPGNSHPIKIYANDVFIGYMPTEIIIKKYKSLPAITLTSERISNMLKKGNFKAEVEIDEYEVKKNFQGRVKHNITIKIKKKNKK